MSTICGVRPTGDLHVGHYFAVIRPGLDGATVLNAVYHAPSASLAVVQELERILRCFGVQKIRRQTDWVDALFYFQLLELAYTGELSRMTQFRSNDSKNAHLYCYPVLMALDVAGFDDVIVGEDQTQHLNFARSLLRRYNKQYETEITIPEAKPIAGRVLSLTDPSKKMSKSDPAGCLFLTDQPDVITHKLKKAATTPEGRQNLLDLYHRLGGVGEPELNSDLKRELARICIEVFAPGRL